MLLTHQLWRQARPISVLCVHPHCLPTTRDPKPGQEGMSPWLTKDLGNREGFPCPHGSLLSLHGELPAGWEGASQCGRGTRTQNWGWAVWEGTDHPYGQHLAVKSVQSYNETVGFISHSSSPQSSSWKCQSKCWLAHVR